MSKQFVLLKTAGKLENYLSRERYALEKMKDNDRVSSSLLETKIGHYNELVNILNVLFHVFSDGDVSEKLFDLYGSVNDFGLLVDTIFCDDPAIEFIETSEKSVFDDSAEKSDEDLWLIKKSEDVCLKAQRSKEVVDDMVAEYENSGSKKIEDYVPEEDVAVSVLSNTFSSDDLSSRSSTRLNYLNHTPDNIRVNDDPAQIVDVKTAVEMNDDNRSTIDIDVNHYAHRSNTVLYDDAIASDLAKLMAVDAVDDYTENVYPDAVVDSSSEDTSYIGDDDDLSSNDDFVDDDDVYFDPDDESSYIESDDEDE